MSEESKESHSLSSIWTINANSVQLIQKLINFKTEMLKLNDKNSDFFAIVENLFQTLSKSMTISSLNLRIVMNERIHNYSKEALNFEEYFSQFILDLNKLASTNIIHDRDFIIILAASMPVFKFYVNCCAPNSLNEKMDIPLYDSIELLYNVLKKESKNYFSDQYTGNLEEMHKYLEKGGELMIPACKDMEEILSIIVSIQESVTSTKLSTLLSKISVFRADIIKPLSWEGRTEDFVLLYKKVKEDLKNIEADIEVSTLLNKLKQKSENINSFLKNSVNEVKLFSLPGEFIDFTPVVEKAVRLSIQNGDSDLESVLKDIWDKQNLQILKNNAEKNANHFSNFMNSVNENDVKMEKEGLAVISEYLYNIWKVIIQIKESTQLSKILVKIRNAASELRNCTSFKSGFDQFLLNIQSLIEVCFIDKSLDQTVSKTILSSGLPTPYSIAQLMKIEENAEFIIQLLKTISSPDSEHSLNKSKEEVSQLSMPFNPSVNIFHVANIEQTNDKIEYVYNLLTKLRGCLKFLASYGELCNFVNLKSMNKAVNPQNANIAEFIHQAVVLTKMCSYEEKTDGIVESCIKIIVATISGLSPQEYFIELAHSIPFIDISNNITESVLKCSKMVILLQKITNEKGIDYLNSAEFIKNLLFNSILGNGISMEVFDQKENYLLRGIIMNCIEWYDFISSMLTETRKTAILMSQICIFNENLNLFLTESVSLAPFIKVNIYNALFNTAKSLVDLGFTNDANLKYFVEKGPIIIGNLYPIEKEEINTIYSESLSMLSKSIKDIHNNNIYDEISSFVHYLNNIASDPTIKIDNRSSKGIIHLMNSFIFYNSGMRETNFEILTLFIISYQNISFDELKKVPAINAHLEKMDEVIKMIESAYLINIFFNIASYISNGCLSMSPSAYDKDKIILRSSNLKKFPEYLNSVSKFINTLNGENNLRKYESGRDVLSNSQALLDKLNEVLAKFENYRKQKEERKIKREKGLDIPYSLYEKKMKRLNTEITEFGSELSSKITNYNSLINDKETVHHSDQIELMRYDTIVEENAAKLIEIEKLKNEIKVIKESNTKYEMKKDDKEDPMKMESDLIRNTLLDAIKPKPVETDRNQELVARLDEITKENNMMLNDLIELQKSKDTHEKQLDMLISRSNEIEILKSKSDGKEEIEKLQYQISQCKSTIETLKKKVKKLHSNNESDNEFSEFLRSTREKFSHDSRHSDKYFAKFFDETFKAANSKIEIKNALKDELAHLRSHALRK